ncbi:uncharacterized protein B0P05DRAFT_562507 [Gilbertella persicaria]|uniref:uncharacterized protein n=1 Tax=Gilbertella persicaria TaxID=101096 RepID=UPI002220CFA4|nr:uncharacterized protein B0P05DRAFT_562507 [Gilbertella persicaria]KAI8051376.1 hypothetical protein B0P05DRAFT_562507 [Gilbertella persicaria]
MAAQQYEFYPPTNMNAIRYTIMQRIKQRNEHRQDTPLTPPTSKHDMDKILPYHHLDNGLPSPPIESCSFEEEQTSDSLLSMHSSTTNILESPPSPVLSLNAKSPTSIDGTADTISSIPVVNTTTDAATTAATESPEEIREKIRLLKEEKHKLFQAMKDLLSQPKMNATTPASPPPTPSSPAPPATTTSPAKPVSSTPHPLERSRSQSRDGSLKARPVVIRSRSISHSEFSRPISRYNANTNGGYHHERSRFYNSNDSRYPYNNRLSLSSTSSTSSSQIASHTMVSCSFLWPS